MTNTPRHIVIAGQGRSGSSLFYALMRSTLTGFCLPETEMPAQAVLHLPGNVCTKRPFDILSMDRIAQAAAGRKQLDLIVTIRDPRDIVTSRHTRVPDDYFCGGDLCYFIPAEGKPTLKMPGYLPLHRAIAAVAQSGLFPQGIFYLKYEDLVQHPDEVQALLADQLGLTFHTSFSRFDGGGVESGLSDAMNGARAVESSRLGKWRAPKHRARLIDQFTRFPELHDAVIALGYAPDRTWFDERVEEGPHLPGGLDAGA